MSKSGALAEQLAAQYLQQQGLKLLQTNYSCRYGEIDLILQDGDIHVFAEVRLRSSTAFGGAAASIDARKQAKLLRTAQHFLSRFKNIPPCRFDAVLMQTTDINKIEWIKNAFTA
ncbi:MAG: YraN family protein [Gallionellaceae bacterium]|jgi:putative endonuclease